MDAAFGWHTCTLYCMAAAILMLKNSTTSQPVSLLQENPYCALYNVWVSEIQVKVSACFRGTVILHQGRTRNAIPFERGGENKNEKDNEVLSGEAGWHYALHAEGTYCSTFAPPLHILAMPGFGNYTILFGSEQRITRSSPQCLKNSCLLQ